MILRWVMFICIIYMAMIGYGYCFVLLIVQKMIDTLRDFSKAQSNKFLFEPILLSFTQGYP